MMKRNCCLLAVLLVYSCQAPQGKPLPQPQLSRESEQDSAVSPVRVRERVQTLSLELLDKAEDERSLQLILLEKLLGSPTTRVRFRAAQVAGRTRFGDGVPVLIEVGKLERDQEVLQEIVFSLGQIGDVRAFPLLLKLAQAAKDPETRVRAVTALGRLSGVDEDGGDIADMVVDALIAVLETKNPSRVTRQAALGVWRHGQAASRAIAVLAALLHREVGVSGADPWPYAYALMKIDHHDTLEPLRRALAHRSGLVRTYAASGLRQPLDSEALEGLDRLLLDPASPWTARVEALRTIGKMRERKWGRAGRARDVLLRHLIQEQHPLVAPVVVESLGMGATTFELPFIIGSLDLQRSAGVRASAAGALAAAAKQGLLTRPQCAEVLAQYVRDPSPWFRVACATAAASLGVEGLAALENYLQDSDRRVRAASVAGLVQIDTPAVSGLIRFALQDEDVSVRQAAVELAADRKLEGWQELLQETWVRSLDAESWELRVKILGVLAETGVGKVLARQSLEDPFRTVRTEAARVLGVPVSPRKGRSPAPRLTPSQLTGEGPARVYLELEQGTMTIDLDLEAAPRHVSDFIDGARKGIYDGRLFHRVVPSFVAQGGGPRGDGWGDEGWHLVDEIHPRTYRRGTVGMPKAGDDTGGSQIFITHLPTPHLDGRYTVFGQVVDGLELLDQIVVGTRILRVSVDENRFRRRVAF